MLWTAPELLGSELATSNGTQEGDIYSFGIIMQEVMYRCMPFGSCIDPIGKDVFELHVIHCYKGRDGITI